MAPSLKALLAAAALAAALTLTAAPAATAADGPCFTPYDSALLGRTFTAAADGGCTSSTARPTVYVTLTAGRVSVVELSPRGSRLRSTTLTFGRAWVTPTVTSVVGPDGRGDAAATPVTPWGAANRAAFVGGLSRMVRVVSAVAGGCGENAQAGGVVTFLRVLAYQYALPAASGVCTA